jgi:hypothetical protein
MLYTVLGLYDPAELALDIRLIQFAPSHHGFARHAGSPAPSRIPVSRATDPKLLGMATVITPVCAEGCRLRA